MSNHLAIATVTGVLQARIRSVLHAHGLGSFGAFVTPPSEGPDPGVYLHLFRVVTHPTLQPRSLPTRRTDGSVAQCPELALNLHYQVSFVGAEANADFGAERAAGLVLAEFHARSGLTAGEIAAFVQGLGGSDPLRNSDLAEQPERVRVSSLSIDLEDHSRLWSMLNQNFHALTVAFEAGPVLIEDVIEPVVSLPVARAVVVVLPSATPMLDQLVSSAREQPTVVLRAASDPDRESLVVRGRNLVGATTEVRIGGITRTLVLDDLDERTLRIPLDASSGVGPGIVGVQVVHRVDVDPAPGAGSLRPVAESGFLAVALVPEVAPGAVVVAGADRLVTVSLTLAPAAEASMTLLLDGPAGHFRGEVESLDPTTNDVQFRVRGLEPGSYLARVQIEGATTLLDEAPGGFSGPIVVVP